MGFEQRGSGFYFYEKVRVGNKVVSRYCGGGQTARLMHLSQQQARGKAKSVRERVEAEKQKEAELDKIIAEYCEEAAALETAMHLAKGFYKHSRQWRRKGNGEKQETNQEG